MSSNYQFRGGGFKKKSNIFFCCFGSKMFDITLSVNGFVFFDEQEHIVYFFFI